MNKFKYLRKNLSQVSKDLSNFMKKTHKQENTKIFYFLFKIKSKK